MLGDIFDRPRPTIELEKIAMQWAQEFNRARINLIIMAGNHDVISKHGTMSALDVIKAADLEFVHVVDRPYGGVVVPELPRFVIVPFPSPNTHASEDAWRAEVESAIAGRKCVGFTHLNVKGAKLGDQEWIYRGGDFDMPEALQEHATMIVNGHIHKQQRVGKVTMLGAAQRLRFSERDNPCSFGWMTSPHKMVRTKHEGIKLRQIDLDVSAWGNNGEPLRTADVIELIAAEDVGKAIVKVQPFTDERSVCQWAEVEAELYKRGAAHVQLATPVFTQRKREQQTKAETAVGEPLEAAKGFIRSRIGDKAERREVYRRFKRLQQQE
jgi:hypothetical protein